MVDKSARNRLWCALRTNSRTLEDIYPWNCRPWSYTRIRETGGVLLHDTALSCNCTCVACDRIGANQLCLPFHPSLSLSLVKRDTRPKVSKKVCICYALRVFQICHTNSLLKQNSKADTFQIVQTVSFIKKIQRVVCTLILTFT